MNDKGSKHYMPPHQTKAQRDAQLANATKGPSIPAKGQDLQKIHSGSTRKGSKQGG